MGPSKTAWNIHPRQLLNPDFETDSLLRTLSGNSKYCGRGIGELWLQRLCFFPESAPSTFERSHNLPPDSFGATESTPDELSSVALCFERLTVAPAAVLWSHLFFDRRVTSFILSLLRNAARAYDVDAEFRRNAWVAETCQASDESSMAVSAVLLNIHDDNVGSLLFWSSCLLTRILGEESADSAEEKARAYLVALLLRRAFEDESQDRLDLRQIDKEAAIFRRDEKTPDAVTSLFLDVLTFSYVHAFQSAFSTVAHRLVSLFPGLWYHSDLAINCEECLQECHRRFPGLTVTDRSDNRFVSLYGVLDAALEASAITVAVLVRFPYRIVSNRVDESAYYSALSQLESSLGETSSTATTRVSSNVEQWARVVSEQARILVMLYDKIQIDSAPIDLRQAILLLLRRLRRMCLLGVFHFSTLTISAAEKRTRRRATDEHLTNMVDSVIDFWMKFIPSMTTGTARLKALLKADRKGEKSITQVDAEFAEDVYLLGISKKIYEWKEWIDPAQASLLISILMPEEFYTLYKSRHCDAASHAVLLGHSVVPSGQLVREVLVENNDFPVDEVCKILQIREILGFESDFSDEQLLTALRNADGDTNVVINAALNGTLDTNCVYAPPAESSAAPPKAGVTTKIGYSFQSLPTPARMAPALAPDVEINARTLQLVQSQMIGDIKEAMRAGEDIDAPVDIRAMIPGLREEDEENVSIEGENEDDKFVNAYSSWLRENNAAPVALQEEDEVEEDGEELGLAAANTGQEDVSRQEPQGGFSQPQARKITNQRKKERMKAAVANHNRRDRRDQKMRRAAPALD